MTNEAKQLLKDKPELCKEIADAFQSFWYPCRTETEWENFLKEHTDKPDWEILSFKDLECDRIMRLNGDGDYDNIEVYRYEWDYSFALGEVKKGLASIESVRRLSDNEVFTVGEHTNCGKIKMFELSGDMMRVFFENKSNYHMGIESLYKSDPVFLSDDGVALFRGENVFVVPKNKKIYMGRVYTYKCRSMKYFSTKKAAEQYLENSKSDTGIDFVRNAHKRIILQDNIELKYVTWGNKTPWERLRGLI